jgi:hypothetical protein
MIEHARALSIPERITLKNMVVSKVLMEVIMGSELDPHIYVTKFNQSPSYWPTSPKIHGKSEMLSI